MKNPEFWSRCEPISVKKNDTLGCEKKNFKFFFPKILVRCEPIRVKKNKTPSVVTVGHGCCAAEKNSKKNFKKKNFFFNFFSQNFGKVRTNSGEKE